MDRKTVLWRRLDKAGHDACCIARFKDGWKIEGTANFIEMGVPALLNYRVICDDNWLTRRGEVSGWMGDSAIGLTVERDAKDIWFSSGNRIPELDGLIDLDLGFTPATNTNAIQRMELAIGQGADTTAAWLDPSDWKLKPLRQNYLRIGMCTYDYESPSHDYRAKLQTDEFGLIVEYPGLWTREP